MPSLAKHVLRRLLPVVVLLVLMLVSQTVRYVSGLIGLGFNVVNSSLCCCSLTGLGFNVPNSSLCVCSLTGLGFNIPNSSLCVCSLIGLGFNVLNSYYVVVISLV